MNVTAVEINTPEVARKYLAGALELLDEFALTPEERVAVLPQIVALLGAKQVVVEQPQPVNLGALAGSIRNRH